jgi:transcriptional regulator with XRE-family HTH domain
MDTDLPLYDYVMARLRAKQLPQRLVAAQSGVPFSTLAKIAQGQIREPSVHTIQRLADFFRKQPLSGLPPEVAEQHQEAA